MDELQRLTEQLRLAESQLSRLDQGTSAYNQKLKEVERLSNQATAAFNSQTGSMLGLGRAYDTIKGKIIEFGNAIAAEAKALDNTTIEFQRTTGATEQLSENIGRLTDNLALFGVSLADAEVTVSALMGTFTEFTQMNAVLQNEIGATVALLNEVGISAASSAKILESSTKTLGMSVDETANMLVNLRASATALGVPVAQLTEDFIGAEEMLAKLGKTGPNTFKELAAQAKATGLELAKITALAEKFDTFEGAASAAQGLNAVLGGNFLDSLYMIEEVDPAKRFLAIRDAIFDAGLSAESLADTNNYYLKKSLAATLGLPVSDFMKMLTGDVNLLTGEVMQAASSLEELREQAFKMKGFDDIMSNVFKQFKKPVTEIQTATRDAFELLTPLQKSIETYTSKVTSATNTFIRNNRQLVGNIGMLYNFFGMDVFQEAFNLMEGTASAMSKTVGFIFSLKGLILGLTGGALYLLHDRVNEIRAAFHLGGVFAAVDTAVVALADKIKTLMGGGSATTPGSGGMIGSIFQTIIAGGKFAFAALRKFVFVPLANYFIREFFFYGDTLLVFFKNKVLPELSGIAIKIGGIFANIFAGMVTEVKGAIADMVPFGRSLYNAQDQEKDRKNIAARFGGTIAGLLTPSGPPAQEKFARGTQSTGDLLQDKIFNDLVKRQNIERYMQSKGFEFSERNAAMSYQQALIGAKGDRNIKAAQTAVNTQLKPAITAAVTTAQTTAAPIAQQYGQMATDMIGKAMDNIVPALQEGLENVKIENKLYIDGKQVQARTIGVVTNTAMAGGQ
tara:strand:+ start:4691 stop:7066 length:2376 start_codon:yes stop_codon:yes gene_type:complete